MKFQINQSELLDLSQSVARSCGFRSQLPVLGNILIKARGDELKLSATNLEIGIVKVVKIDIEEEGEVTVPAKVFLEVISNLDNTKITLIADNTSLQIKTDSFSSQINGISAAEFPEIPLSGKEAISIDAKVLFKFVPQVIFAAAVDEGRPQLTAVLTEVRGDLLRLIATDGYRLAHKDIAVGTSSSFKALIPKTTLEEVVRLISEDDAETVQISLSEDQNQIIFSFATTQLSSRLIEGNFPNWEKIIPSEFQTRIVIGKGVFVKAVKLASVFARDESNIVRILAKDNQITLLSEAKELGSQKNELSAQIEGEELTVAFNSKYLTEALNAFSSSQIIIELSGSLSATSIKPMGEEGLQYIIMPVNVS